MIIYSPYPLSTPYFKYSIIGFCYIIVFLLSIHLNKYLIVFYGKYTLYCFICVSFHDWFEFLAATPTTSAPSPYWSFSPSTSVLRCPIVYHCLFITTFTHTWIHIHFLALFEQYLHVLEVGSGSGVMKGGVRPSLRPLACRSPLDKVYYPANSLHQGYVKPWLAGGGYFAKEILE